jgi:hypothetical protein
MFNINKYTYNIIIIVIIRNKLGLHRLVSASSSSRLRNFQVVFLYLLYNLVLFLASCCYSFLLLVVDNLICIVLVPHQMVLLSTLLKFIYFFCGEKVGIPLFF